MRNMVKNGAIQLDVRVVILVSIVTPGRSSNSIRKFTSRLNVTICRPIVTALGAHFVLLLTEISKSLEMVLTSINR